MRIMHTSARYSGDITESPPAASAAVATNDIQSNIRYKNAPPVKRGASIISTSGLRLFTRLGHGHRPSHLAETEDIRADQHLALRLRIIRSHFLTTVIFRYTPGEPYIAASRKAKRTEAVHLLTLLGGDAHRYLRLADDLKGIITFAIFSLK